MPVVDDPEHRRRPGGAALAALLAAREHPDVVLIAPLADDDAAARIADLLAGRVRLVAIAVARHDPGEDAAARRRPRAGPAGLRRGHG